MCDYTHSHQVASGARLIPAPEGLVLFAAEDDSRVCSACGYGISRQTLALKFDRTLLPGDEGVVWRHVGCYVGRAV